MKVKSYLVKNREEFINQLEEELCKNGISYVKIGYEFHFLDHIIRFYDFEIDKRMIIDSFFIRESQKRRKQIEEAMLTTKLRDKMLKKCNPNDLIVKLNYQENNSSSTHYQKRTKFEQKQESNQVKQKLKRYQ